MSRPGCFALLLLAAACGSGCGKEPAKLKGSIGGFGTAKGMLVAPGTGSGGGASSNVLYTLNADDSLTVTTVVEGETTSEETKPLAVFETPLYVAIAFAGLEAEGRRCPWVLARKSDGALFCLPLGDADARLADQANAHAVSYFAHLQSNAAGNLLWINGPSMTRVDLGDPAAPVATTPVDSAVTGGRHFDAFAVNGRGDALLSFSFDRHQSRIEKAQGGFQNISTERIDCLFPGFAANPDDFYFIQNGEPVKLVDTGSTFTPAAGGPTFPAGTESMNCASGMVHTPTAVFVTSGTTLARLEDAAVSTFAVPTVTKITQVSGDASVVMLMGQDAAGNGGIVRFDVASEQFTTLLPPGDYSLTRMAVGAGGELTFHGQRASDGAFIVGNVAPGSTQVQVVATGIPALISIVRLN